jgi:hypothetical protein
LQNEKYCYNKDIKIRISNMMYQEKMFMRAFEEPDGKAFEKALFGRCSESISKEKKEFLKENDYYDLVRTNQPYENSRNPKFSEHTKKESFPQKLTKEIVKELLIATKRRNREDEGDIQLPNPFLDVRFYTAVDSGLDERYGVDAFVEWYLPNGEVKEQVTLNATLHDYKKKQRADILFSFPEELKKDFHKEEDAGDLLDKKDCNVVVSELASVVARRLMKHTEKKETLHCVLKKEVE